MKTTQIAHQLTIKQIVDQRDQVVAMFEHGRKSIEKSIELSKELLASGVYLAFWRSKEIDNFTQDLDRRLWRYLFEISGTSQLMNAEQKAAFEFSIKDEVPAITEDSVRATLAMAKDERGDTFIKGLVGVLQGVCSSYKSNKSFEINKKLIFCAINGWGEYAFNMKNRMIDIERMIHIVNNEKIPKISVTNVLYNMAGTAGVKEFKYFTVKTFKNGNAHMIINCTGTLRKLNSMIAEYFDGNAIAKN